MKRILAVSLLASLFAALTAALVLAQAGRSDNQVVDRDGVVNKREAIFTPEHFVWVDVFIDTGKQPLGAYQLQFSDDSHQSLVAGVEGGEPAAFSNPPYYDPAALQHEQVILAAYSTAGDLPKGRTRVARIHLLVKAGFAPPRYVATLESAADAAGNRIPATVELHEGAAP